MANYKAFACLGDANESNTAEFSSRRNKGAFSYLRGWLEEILAKIEAVSIEP